MAKRAPAFQPALVLERQGDVLRVRGALTLPNLPGQAKSVGGNLRAIDARDVSAMDTVGAMWLFRLTNGQKVRLEGLNKSHRLLFAKVGDACRQEWKNAGENKTTPSIFESAGRASQRVVQSLYEVSSLLGQVVVAFGQIAMGTRAFRWNAFARHVREAGLMALPIVMLISFLMSIVLAYQGVSQLSLFGAQRYAINLVAISTLREMGGLLAAIMVAGRSGSSFTSEIGVMKIREEVDAMSVMGLSPLDVMILPRIAALTVALPLLTVAAFVAGILGGGLMSIVNLGVDFPTYLHLFAEAVNGHTHWVGLVKAPVFALFIGIISCVCGLRVAGSADSVGQQTTRAVVEGIFAVLVIDALFSIFFAKIGW